MSFKRNKDNANYGGSNQHLPSGIYLITIIRCTENEHPKYGGARFEFEYDIAEGDYKGFFNQAYEAFRSRTPNAYWKGTFNQEYEGKKSGYMDALINRFEDANRSFRYRDDGGRCFEGFEIMASIQALETEYNGFRDWKYYVKMTYTPEEVEKGFDVKGKDIIEYSDVLLDKPAQAQATTKRTSFDINDSDIQF